jgi:hypothetical protein
VFEAARKPVSSTVEDVNAYNTSTLESALHEAGLAVRNNTTLITAPNPKLVERTLTIHEKRMELAIRTQFRRDMEDAAVEAARAFRGMNWPRVIELLSPYEGHLNAATTKKLVQARKFIIDI